MYFPSSGAFENEHFELWGICRGTYCGVHDTGQLPANSVDYVGHPDRHNNVLTVAATLWVYFNPHGTYGADGAKTHDCTFPSTGSICRY